MPTWLRYLLFQVPGWAVTGTILASLWHWQWITFSLALLGFTALLLKDLIFYPILKHAYEGGAKTGAAALIGARGVAQENLNPSGYIRVRGELWQAVAVDPNKTLASGIRVEIVDAEGMQLFVRAVPDMNGENES